MKPKVVVYCDINSRTADHPRHRVLMFMYEGVTIELDQRLVVWHDGTIGYIDEMKTPMAYDPEWADDLKVVLDYVKWFAEKSRPHWEKLVTDVGYFKNKADLCIDVDLRCSPKTMKEVKAKKNELEAAILLTINNILDNPSEINMDALDIFPRGY